MGFRKKKVFYDYVVTSPFIEELMHCIQSSLDSLSKDDDVRTVVTFESKFSLTGKCRIFEIVGVGKMPAIEMNRRRLLDTFKRDEVISDLALEIYKDACNLDLDEVKVAAAYVNRAPVSKQPGLILFWRM